MPGETTAPEMTEEDAAFDAGFDAPAQTETPAATVTDTPATEQATEPAPEPKYVQITEDDWNAVRKNAEGVEALRQEQAQKFDKAFGHVGSLKQAVDGLSKRGVVDISPDDFAELREEYGSEIAEKIALGLKRANERAIPKPPEPQQQVAAPAVDDRLAKIQADLINSRLDEVVDGDWQAEVRTPAFNEWMKKQPADVQSLGASESVRDAARMLRLWTASKTATPAATPSAPAAPVKPSARQRVMAAAVNPRGAGVKAPASNEIDPFDEGFNS